MCQRLCIRSQKEICENDVLEIHFLVILLLSLSFFSHQSRLILLPSGIKDQLTDVNINICHALTLQAY